MKKPVLLAALLLCFAVFSSFSYSHKIPPVPCGPQLTFYHNSTLFDIEEVEWIAGNPVTVNLGPGESYGPVVAPGIGNVTVTLYFASNTFGRIRVYKGATLITCVPVSGSTFKTLTFSAPDCGAYDIKFQSSYCFLP